MTGERSTPFTIIRGGLSVTEVIVTADRKPVFAKDAHYRIVPFDMLDHAVNDLDKAFYFAVGFIKFRKKVMDTFARRYTEFADLHSHVSHLRAQLTARRQPFSFSVLTSRVMFGENTVSSERSAFNSSSFFQNPHVRPARNAAPSAVASFIFLRLTFMSEISA